MTGDFIDCADPRWTDLLARTSHDVYHLPRYVAFSAEHEGGAPVAYYAEAFGSAFLLPLLVRPVPADLVDDAFWFDATSPYGYPGPLVAGSGGEERVRGFLEMFRADAREYGLVTAFIRLHPFFGVRGEDLGGMGECVRQGDLVYVDLKRSPEEHWSETRGNHRTGVNKLKRRGFDVAFDDWGHYAAFPALYRSTMSRVAAADRYMFSDAYFEGLREAVGGALHLCTVLAPGGEIAAAGIFFASSGIVQYHLGATAEAFLGLAPSKLLFHEVRNWAREQGHELLHLGGGVGSRADSLLHFKAGFSRLQTGFHTLRMVLDADGYALLGRRWREWSAWNDEDPDFFPIYRVAGPAIATHE